MSTLILQLVCKISRLKCVGVKTESSYCDPQRVRSATWRFIEPCLYKLLDEVFVISEHLAVQLRSFGYRGKITLFPIIVDENMYECMDLNRKNRTIVYLGSLGHHRELRLLLYAYALVKAQHSDWQLVLAGAFPDGKSESALRELMEELGVASNVTLIGHLSTEEVPVLLGSGGIMVLPRLDEEYARAGFPIKLGEYLLSGAPVVSTAVGEIPKYLRDEETAFLVSTCYPASLANKIVSVINNYCSALRVGERGQRLAQEEFSLKKICKLIVGA